MSLSRRVLLAASAVLISFFGLAGFTLDRTYRVHAEQALVETLQGNVFTLVAAAELDERGRLHLPELIPDARFSSLGSGLFAQVTGNASDWRWQSASMQGMRIPFASGLARTERATGKVRLDDGRELYLLSYGVVWGEATKPELAYTFAVAQDLATFNADLADFRRSLWGALAGVAVILLAVQGTILRWGLSPLKQASGELTAIEAGRQTQLSGRYPKELQGLTENLNALLTHQQEHLERYRKSLGDLAHSLKTPLAVLQNAAGSQPPDAQLDQVVREQVERMNQITGYQLSRAATAGRTALAAPVAVAELVHKVVAGLQKVYRDKGMEFSTEIDPGGELHADEGDVLEIIGNLTDNAGKWCRRRVAVAVACQRIGTEDWLQLRVEDDGPGLPPTLRESLGQRGQRADHAVPGHGIGLSIVRDIVRLYGGRLSVGSSRWGGALVTVELPVKPA